MTNVFLSYRHENSDHLARTCTLGEQLEVAGFTVVLDQFAQKRLFRGGGPDEGWPRWSRLQASSTTNKILIIASPGWFRAYDLTEPPVAGLGAASEAAAIEQRIYNSGGISKDIRIVEFEGQTTGEVSIGLQRYHRFSLPKDWNDLICWLSGHEEPTPALTDWASTPPPLSWLMADHENVRQALAQLMTSQTDRRYLPIRGSSESGKSHVTRQLLGNALRYPGLACGRFDCKGMSDVDDEFQRFVHHLDLQPILSAPTLKSRFSAVLNALCSRKRPALLIFDTFEEAGELDHWVKETLLVALIRQNWLRIVIAGQRVPEPEGFAWNAEASKTIILTPPEAKHWHEFGREYRPALTLADVETVHRCAGGRSSLMYQMFGPPP